MDSSVFTAVSKGFTGKPRTIKSDPLPLASLRLLVPPFQLMAASMWQYILELCRSEQPVEPDFIMSILNQIKLRHPILNDIKESQEEEVAINFLEVIQTLLKDPEERQDFFLEVFPAEYGPQYDSDLQMLFSEFICRLAQLLPVPDLEQTVSWLGAERSVLEDCVHSVSEPTDLNILLQHHKHLGHLEQHVPPSSMGDSILSSLSAAPSSRAARPTEQPDQSDTQQGLCDDAHTASFVDDIAVEIVAVTDYAEVELDASTGIEVATGENSFEGTVCEINCFLN